MRSTGWATGYALSIFGNEYQISAHLEQAMVTVMDVLFLSLKACSTTSAVKGGGPTPYCRGADGRAVCVCVRSSAQEHTHALGIASSRSLSLFVSQSETVDRPWYRRLSLSGSGYHGL